LATVFWFDGEGRTQSAATAIENAAPDTEVTHSRLDILHAEPSLLRKGAEHGLSFNAETPIYLRGGFPLLPFLHLNRGQTSVVTLSAI
jgi:hypothetical protein